MLWIISDFLAELMEVPIAIVSLGANRDQTIVIEDPIHGPKRALLRWFSSKLMKESFRHFEHNKKVDLIGLGNAIVDIIVNIEDEFLEINNLDKGSMNLIILMNLRNY